jgi:hypothetical protein
MLKGLLNTFAVSTCLKVNYSKSSMLPINISIDRLDHLARTFDRQTGSLPFTYLGLVVDTTRPIVEHFEPMVHKVERRLIFTSIFLTQA